MATCHVTMSVAFGQSLNSQRRVYSSADGADPGKAASTPDLNTSGGGKESNFLALEGRAALSP